MPTVAKLFNTKGGQALRLPDGFRFSGKTVRLRQMKNGIVHILPEKGDDLEKRRRLFMKLAGSCPNFPEIPRARSQ